jgi:hypothetical protein
MIHLQLPYRKQLFLNAQKFRFNLQTKPLRRQAFTYLIAGAVLLFLTVDEPDDSFLYIIAWFAFLLGGLQLIRYVVSLLRLRKIAAGYADRYESEQMAHEYVFDQERVSYSDKEKSFSFRWHLLQGYTLTPEYLVLHILSKRSCDLVLLRSHFTPEQFGELTGYLAKTERVAIR